MSAEQDVKLENFSSIFSCEGKVAVITGGSRGLGLHAASGLLQAGCSKVYISSRKAKACEEAAAALNALPNKRPGAQAISIPADGAKVSEIERLVEEVKKTTDHVDILVANAGASWGVPFEGHTEKDWDKIMGINVKGVFFLVQKFAPLLEAKATQEDPSRVIITGSIAGIGLASVEGDHTTFSYAASKAAVIHLGKQLAVGLGPRRIMTNVIAPGFFPSKMSNGLLSLSGGAELLASYSPNERLGKAEDFAGLTVFLASRAASHINGAVIPTDGGAVVKGRL
ncbi:hypothetical protein KEM56_004155 [Ascosphaera pollenicola]|nr:hypothetical protein KEM56_004155 [Ascosphaera pollenicola]